MSRVRLMHRGLEALATESDDDSLVVVDPDKKPENEENTPPTPPAEDGAVDSTPEDTPDDVDAKAFIINPDDLNVTKVEAIQSAIEKTTAAGEIEKEKIQTQALQLQDATKEADEVVASVEVLQSLIHARVTATDALLKYHSNALTRSRYAVGFSQPRIISNEALDSNKSRKDKGLSVVLEGFKDTLVAIWEAIVRFIGRIVTNIKTFFKGLFNTTAKTEASIESVTKELLDLRAANTDKLDSDANQTGSRISILNKENYVADPAVSPLLKINAVWPADIREQFEYLADIADIGAYFGNMYSKAWFNVLEKNISGVIETGSLTGDMKLTSADFSNFSPTSKFMTGRITKEYNGKNAPQDCWWGVSKPTIGNFVQAWVIPDQVKASLMANNNIVTPLEYFQLKSKMAVEYLTLNDTNSKTLDSWMPWMSTEDIQTTSVAATRALSKLASHDNNTTILDKTIYNLKEVADSTSKAIAGIKVDQNNPNDPFITATPLLQAIGGTVNAAIAVIATTVPTISSYVQRTCVAWNFYLKLVIEKEKKLVAGK